MQKYYTALTAKKKKRLQILEAIIIKGKQLTINKTYFTIGNSILNIFYKKERKA